MPKSRNSYQTSITNAIPYYLTFISNEIFLLSILLKKVKVSLEKR
jgi:hypothetical protein